jgi:hypothetical protein
MRNTYGTDEVVFQTLTGTLQSDDGSPLLSTSSDGGTAYAIGDALSAGIYSGIQNGNLSAPPQAIGSADPISDSNPLPYFTFVDASSGRITAYAVEDSLQANGYSIRFRAIGAQSGDKVYLERRVSAPSSRAQSYVYSARGAFTAASNTAGYSAFVETQYLKADGTTTTGAANTATQAGTYIQGFNSTALEIVSYPAAGGAVPSDGASILFRTGVSFSTAVAGTVSIDLVEMRLVRGTTVVPFVDQQYPGESGGLVAQTGRTMILHSNSLGTAGFNPKIELSTNTGSIFLNAAGTIAGGGTPTSGDIELRTKDGGYVYFGAGTANADVRVWVQGANQLRTDDQIIVGDRTSASPNQVDAQGVILDAAAGFSWIDRSPNNAATDSSLFLSSGYFNGNLQMVRFFRKITVGGTVLTGTGHILVANNNTTAPSFAAGSDYRLKTDIRSASEEIDFVEKIDGLRPVLFTNRESGDENLLGFIAHEVAPHIPEAVEGEKDGVDDEGNPAYQSLAAAKMIPYLVGAVRDLSARIKELERNAAE